MVKNPPYVKIPPFGLGSKGGFLAPNRSDGWNFSDDKRIYWKWTLNSSNFVGNGHADLWRVLLEKQYMTMTYGSS